MQVAAPAPDVFDIVLSDGSISPLRVYRHRKRPRMVSIMIVPGVGMGASYYDPIALALSELGYDVAITELRGQGNSSYRAGRRSAPAGYHNAAVDDLPAAASCLDGVAGKQSMVFLGHSMGGQQCAVYAARPHSRVDGLVLVASQSPYYRGFESPLRNRILVGAILGELSARILGKVPGRLFGGVETQAAERIRDWAVLARRGRIAPIGRDLDYAAAMRETQVPILAIVIQGDKEAPTKAAQNLLSFFPSSHSTLEIEPTPLGHSRWARNPALTVERVDSWIKRTPIIVRDV